ncbi:MAG TPA: GYF domain-containing protein [Gemmataceae bacterium]
MTDRWYYTHAGKTLGPVTAAQLRQLASSGQLTPTDLIWPDGRDRTQAVEARFALDFLTPAAPPQNKPDWLDDVRADEKRKSTAPARPDWLEDVRASEAEQQEFLTLEFDADNLPPDEETMAKQLLDELEEGAGPQPTTEFIPEPEGEASCRLIVGSATTRGRVRARNEDSLLVQQCTWGNLEERHDVLLAVVADGMGGHQAGDRASGLVIRAMGNVLAPLFGAALGEQGPPAPAVLAETLDNGLREANRIVLQTAKDNPAFKGMGSTAVALLVWDGRAFISLVGDCRVYHWRGGKLTQVTRDQTLVGRMVELGQLSPAEAARHPRRNEVWQAVGKYALLEPARYELALAAGDWLVAGCDGLQAHVDDRMLGEAIAKAGASAIGLANRLIELANQGGGSDNCTVVAVHCV